MGILHYFLHGLTHPSLVEGEEILTRGKLHLSPFTKQNLHIPLDHLLLIATHE
jgi:hypothetical protein